MCSFSYLEPVCCSMSSSNLLHPHSSRGRSSGLLFPPLSEFSTVYCDQGQLACLDASLATSIFSQQKPEGMSPLVTRSQDRNKMKRELESLSFLHKNGFFLFFSFTCGTLIVHIQMSLFLIYQYLFIDIYYQFLYQEQN